MILLLLMVACGGTQPERRPGAGGQKRIEGVYNSGLKQGVWRSWSVDGTEQPSDLYVDDVLQTQPKERED